MQSAQNLVMKFKKAANGLGNPTTALGPPIESTEGKPSRTMILATRAFSTAVTPIGYPQELPRSTIVVPPIHPVIRPKTGKEQYWAARAIPPAEQHACAICTDRWRVDRGHDSPARCCEVDFGGSGLEAFLLTGACDCDGCGRCTRCRANGGWHACRGPYSCWRDRAH